MSDASCTEVHAVVCDDVLPSSECEVRLQRTFVEPGTYCVNITLLDYSSVALTSTTVTISKSQDAPGELFSPHMHLHTKLIELVEMHSVKFLINLVSRKMRD